MRKFFRRVTRVFAALIVLILLLVLTVFIGLDFFGEVFIRKYVTKEMDKATHGLYTLEFEKFSYNIFNGNLLLTKVRLNPDTAKYNQLKREGKASRALYQASFGNFAIQHLDLRAIYYFRILKLRELVLERPEINIVSYPDTTVTKKKGHFSQIYADIYPVFSSILEEITIDSVKVLKGSLETLSESKKGMKGEGVYHFSAKLTDFNISRNAYHDTTRVFYSKDIELRFSDVEYILADSLYFLKAREAGFTLKSGRLFGENISLVPNFKSGKLSEANTGNFYVVKIPRFNINGINLFNVLLAKQVALSKVEFDSINFILYRHINPKAKKRTRERVPKGKEIRVANLYTIISDRLKSVSLDTLVIRNARWEYYSSLNERAPEIVVSRMDLNLEGFRLDSLAHLDTNKILFSKNIEIGLNGVSMALEDKYHNLTAQNLFLSTKRSLLKINNLSLYPSESGKKDAKSSGKTLLSLFIPEAELERINIRRLMNFNKLEFDSLLIAEPESSVAFNKINERPKREPGGPRTTMRTIKEPDLSKLVSPYFNSIHGKAIHFRDGSLQVTTSHPAGTDSIKSALFDLRVLNINIDSNEWDDENVLMSNLDFDFTLLGFRYRSHDTMTNLSLGNLFVSTTKREISAKEISYNAFRSGHGFISSRSGKAAPSIAVAADSFLLSGFDYLRYINNKELVASLVKLDNPSFNLQSLEEEKISKEKKRADFLESIDKNVASLIKVNNFIITKGDIVIDRQRPGKRSFLSAGDFDLALKGFRIETEEYSDEAGLVQFDSLSVRLNKSRPFIFDSVYSIYFPMLRMVSMPKNVTLLGLSLRKLVRPEGEVKDEISVEASVPVIQIGEFDMEKLIFGNEVDVKDFYVHKPEISITQVKTNAGPKPGKIMNPEGELSLPAYLRSINIGKFNMNDFLIHYTRKEGDSVKKIDVGDLSLEITNFSCDSGVSAFQPGRAFYSDDIRISKRDFSTTTKDSMYTLRVGNVTLSTHDRSLTVDSFSLIPNYSQYEFAQKLGYQADRTEIFVPRILLENIELEKLANEKKFHAGMAVIEGLQLNDFKDKRLPIRKDVIKPLFQEQLRDLKFEITIDTAELRNGKVVYSEQTKESPGMIFFDRMNVRVNGITNDPDLVDRGVAMEAGGTAYFMGEALMKGQFRFPLNALNDTFSFSGGAGTVRLSSVNPMLSKLMPVEILSGYVDSLHVYLVHGNDRYSEGYLEVGYSDLAINLTSTNKKFLRRWETELLQFVINNSLPQETEISNRLQHKGYIYWDRTMYKGFFNYLWKSIYTGLKSSAGFNDKKQKEVRKSMRLAGK
jgi:hypothetical protein